MNKSFEAAFFKLYFVIFVNWSYENYVKTIE